MRDDESAVCFGDFDYFCVSGDAAVVVVDEDWVAVGFDGVVADHCVACYYYADLAFAPLFVEVGVFFCWVAAVGLDVLE